MALSPQIVVVGSHAPGLFIRVHRVPVAGETVMGWDYQEPIDGGKGSNQAIAAARLGAMVSFVGCVGQDRLGDEGERWMREAGVDTAFLRRSSSSATVGGFVILDDEGLPAIVAAIGANGDLTEEEVESALRAMPKAGVMLTQFEIHPRVAVHAAKIARSLGMTAIVNPAPAPDRKVEGLEAAHILTPNETEAKVLLGLSPDQHADPVGMAQALRKQTGADCVMVTVGERGVVAAEKTGVWQVEPPTVEAVDTTGAGDAFNAGLAVGLVQGMSLREAADWGCLIAAYSVTRPGTIPIYPKPDEVERFKELMDKSL
jgi:ribokinase